MDDAPVHTVQAASEEVNQPCQNGSVHPFLASTLGGTLIGLAASWLWLANGRIAGISGIAAGLADARVTDRQWRAAFIFGLWIVGALAYRLAPSAFHAPVHSSAGGLWMLAGSGLLVGVGTRLGGGCTSGHGVCGISRWSKRALVATLTFMLTAAVSVFVLRHGGMFR